MIITKIFKRKIISSQYTVYSLLISLLIFGCSNPNRETQPKSIQFISRYDGMIKLEELRGIQLYPKGSGVDNHSHMVRRAAFGKNTRQPIFLSFPLLIKWTVYPVEGNSFQIKREIDSIEGVEGNRIEDKCTIWVFFDEKADVHIRYFPDNNMTSHFELFESLGRDRDGRKQ